MPVRVPFIVEALGLIGEPATDQQIFDRLSVVHPEEEFGKTPVNSVRARMQERSSDSDVYLGRSDIFYRVPPPPASNAQVKWGLREWNPSNQLGGGQRSETMEDGLQDEAEAFMSEEGRRNLRVHLAHERSRELVSRFKNSLERFDCCVCCFNFETAYGPLGRQFIEAHHVLPVAEAGQRMASLKDLIAVCSNCHRMLHRNGLLAWQELRAKTHRRKS
jgi:hypothetical protein